MKRPIVVLNIIILLLFSLIVVLSIVILLLFSFPVYAGPPLDAVQSNVNKVLEVLRDPKLKEAAIDPYVAIRDAYVQYRMNMVNKASLSK